MRLLISGIIVVITSGCMTVNIYFPTVEPKEAVAVPIEVQTDNFVKIVWHNS